MRKIRAALTGAAIVALVAAFGGLALAQSEEDMVPAATTGTLVLNEAPDTATHDEPIEHVHTWTAEDPRLTGTATYTGSWHIYDPPAEDCDDPEAAAGAVYAIVNEGGTWACSGIRAPIPGPDGARNVHVLALTGTGGYEGLYAYIMIDWSTEPFTFSALITPNKVPIEPVMQG
jgi:hypothetical protein